MTRSLFVIHYCSKSGMDECYYGNGVFCEDFNTILDLLKEENVVDEANLFKFLMKYKLAKYPLVLNIAYCLTVMDRIVLCKIFLDGYVKFQIYNEIIENEGF